MGEETPDVLLVYPEGNYIRASEERPFLQIGESKYGKFLLEVGVHEEVDMVTALKVALSSMISTARANLSVGRPYVPTSRWARRRTSGSAFRGRTRSTTSGWPRVHRRSRASSGSGANGSSTA